MRDSVDDSLVSPLASLMTASPASADVRASEPHITTIDDDWFPVTAINLGVCELVCAEQDTPPEDSGGVSCGWHSRTTLSWTRASDGGIHGEWQGMYVTSDCLNGSHDPVHMGYMFVRATTSFQSSVYQTAPTRTCTVSGSPQCSGLTSLGNDASCTYCNGWWYLTVTVAWRLPNSMGGTWPPQDPDGPCVRSSDGRQLDCQRRVGALIE